MISAGDKVAWNYASSRVEGEVAEVQPEKVTLSPPLVLGSTLEGLGQHYSPSSACRGDY